MFYFCRATIANTWDTQEGLFDSIANVQEPGNKVAIAMDTNLLLELSMMKAQLEAKILKGRLMADFNVIYFPAHHSFFNSFNEKFKQMFEAGLFDQYIREAEEFFKRHTSEYSENSGKVLTLQELEAGFVVCMVPLLLAVVVFCLEWIVTLKDLVVFLCIFQAFFKTKHVEMAKNFKSGGLLICRENSNHT